ncbi:cohesin domain-containing protein [Geomonas sp. Red32]|uniref:cohesin domain-containing protein n=1 Tax=Geomonas sp. Red32 TaxID=2912856 RepID=UPI0033130583
MKPICTLLLVALTLTGCTAGRSAFNKGERLEAAGDLDGALVKYTEVATAYPEVGEYRVRLLNTVSAASKKHFRKGEAFFAVKSYSEAVKEYETAFAIDPTYVQARLQAELSQKLANAAVYVQEAAQFEKDRKPREAMVSYRHALEFDPNSSQAKEGISRLTSLKHHKLDGYELNLKSTKPITLKFKDAKLKEIFNILSQLSGINFVFDDTVKDVNISLFLENATFQQAMEIITGMNKLEKKVLNESTIILYPRTPDKLKQYEELYVETFYLNKLEAKKAVNLIRTMLQVKKIYVNDELNALVIRDTPEVIAVARKILEANDVPDAEVLLDVEVFELSKQDSETFGLALSKYGISAAASPPGSTSLLTDSLSSVTTTSTTSTTTPATPSNLINFFAYRGYNGYLTVPNATFNFGKTLSNGETLANPKIRVKNREKAKFNVGTRVPITTTSSPSGGGVSVNVQYVDVGVKVNAEPTIQLNNEVSIKLGVEVSTITDKSVIGTDQATTVVTIGTRNLDTVLSLKDGETTIIGGLIQKSKTDSKQKIFLLGDIPFLGSLFTNTNDSAGKSEILLAITPRIVRGVTVPEGDVAAFWSGREEEPSTNKPYSSFEEPDTLPDSAAPAAGANLAPGSPVVSATPVAATAAADTNAPAPGSGPGRARRKPASMTRTVNPPSAQTVPAGEVPDSAAAGQAAPAAVPAANAAVPVPAPAPVADPMAAPVPPASSAPVAVPVTPPSQAVPAPAPADAVPAPPAAKAVVPVSKLSLALGVPATVNIRDRFEVKVNVDGAKDLYNSVFVLTYDPKLLEPVSQAAGPFLKKDGQQVNFQSFVLKSKGELWITASRMTAPGGVTGDGTLAIATFKAIANGKANLGFANTNFSTKQGGVIAVTPFKAIVEVK